MDVRHLRYFVAVAETGSFSAAARRCHVAQPSLSQQIHKLESELGQPLFDRLGRSIALTGAGVLLLPRARRILDELREATEELALGQDRGLGTLTVGAIPTVAPYLLPPAIRRFSAAWPQAVLQVQEDLTEILVAGLIAAELDLALIGSAVQHEAIELTVLAEDRFLVALPEDHPLAARDELALAEIAEQPAVVLDELHCLGQQVEELCRVMKVNLRISCRAMQLATLLDLVALGVGIALVPEMAATCRPESTSGGGGCVFLPVAGAFPHRQIAIATRRGRPRSFLTEQFTACLGPEEPPAPEGPPVS